MTDEIKTEDKIGKVEINVENLKYLLNIILGLLTEEQINQLQKIISELDDGNALKNDISKSYIG